MSTISNVGILGLGIYLPEPVRRNDWWEPAIVATWKEKMEKSFFHWQEAADESPTPGMAKVLDALRALKDDPFQGSVERRVIPDVMDAWDMETEAARDAIRRAGIDKREIGLVLSFTMCPDYIHVPSACVVHERLGLRPDCMSLNGDGVCNSFLMQLAIAEQMIRGGRARYALLVQSSAVTRIAVREDPASAWWGDGATAAVVGPVREGRGLSGSAWRTNGALHRAVVVGTKEGRWYDEGRAIAYPAHPPSSRRMLLGTPDAGREIVPEALAHAGHTVRDVDFFASHQATAWFRRVAQEHIGLDRARSLDTFPTLGSLSGANVPMVLAMAEREGLLRDGDLVAMYSGGTGITFGSVVARWGI